MAFIDTESMIYFVDFVREAAGVKLSPEKAYLVESRIKPVAEENGLTSLREICLGLSTPGNGRLRSQVISAITTHETFFFRDITVFKEFEDIIRLRFYGAHKAECIRVWSAACSTGQEAYSVAMLFLEVLPGLDGSSLRIMATDLSEDSLEAAQAGVYTPLEVSRGLPTPLLLKYFKQEGRNWRVSEKVKELVTFRRSNLLWETPPGGAFDVVLCRNVLIYFQQETAVEVLDRLKRSLNPGGYLLLGGTENLMGRCAGLRQAGRKSACILQAETQ